MPMHNIVIIDNEDSFTYNLVSYFKNFSESVKVFRNTISTEKLKDEPMDLMVLSPGPSVPRKAGNLMNIINEFHERVPMFGVCLGHQALIEFFGGSLRVMNTAVQGKSSQISHDGKSVFSGLDSPMTAGRYHALIADNVPDVLEITSQTEKGEVMSVRHKYLPIEGVQFHPESVLTMEKSAGKKMIQNVMEGKLATGNIRYATMMHQLQREGFLTEKNIDNFIESVCDRQLSDDQKMVLLLSISEKLKFPNQLYSFVKKLLGYNAFQKNDLENLKKGFDPCGTGGSNLPRVNTSTLATIILAAMGIPIIKHGNKAASGRFGSFNLLENLGLNINESPEKVLTRFKKNNLAFVFAQKAHPVMKEFAPIRKRIGVPTVFNILGPLLNPFPLEKQLIGTAFENYMELILDTAIMLGRKHIAVVRGNDGLDEITITGKTKILEYKNGTKKKYEITPEEFGVQHVPFEKIRSFSQAENIRIANEILSGTCNSPHKDLICVNAAFIHSRFFSEMSLKESYQCVSDFVSSGKPMQYFQNYLKS